MTAIEKLIERYNHEADQCAVEASNTRDSLAASRITIKGLSLRQVACEIEVAWRQDLCESLSAGLPGFDPDLPIHEQTISGRN